ncbi:metal-dependent hydrolase [Marinicrinis sediminis]|uniref:Metal-dependent hydrolase n=1 Tax=Marinicrinis sediminis TaxID=1652465 RepID=A0ABW5R7K2_9BACL
MDTGTHFVIGLGLGGLAMVDPVLSADTTTAAAAITGMVLGSQAPDADTILRLKGNATYIRNHRGITHSLPFLFIWTLVITGILTLVFGSLPIVHIAAWVFLAVALHVFSDLFNTYGTQAIRPFSHKWISWNIIHIFDPYIFASHTFALILWGLGISTPQIIFPVLYSTVVLYYVIKTVHHYRLTRSMPQLDPEHVEGESYMLIPTVKYHVWNVVKKQADGEYRLGELSSRQLKWIDSASCSDHPLVKKAEQHPDIQSFLYFTKYACAEWKEHPWGYEVRWFDVRYRHRKQYPFVAVVVLNRNEEIMDSYVGWISDKRMEKKLRFDSY